MQRVGNPPGHLNEVLSIRAQESPFKRGREHGNIHLNEVLSIRAQESCGRRR